MPVTKRTKSSANFLAIRGQKVLIDTNILILCFGEAKSEQRKILKEFFKQNQIYICDTVYWEFLRNTSVENFRKKHETLHEWIGKNGLLFEEGTIIKANFEWMSLIYFHVLGKKMNNVKKYLGSNPNDRWILTTALTYEVSFILTSDHGGGFLQEILNEKKYRLGNGSDVYLYSSNLSKIEEHFNQIQADGVVKALIS